MTEPNPYRPPLADAQSADAAATARTEAAWALGAAILSLFVCAHVAAPYAIFKARRALKAGPSKRAFAAIVLASTGLLLSIVFWFFAIWQFLDPA